MTALDVFPDAAVLCTGDGVEVQRNRAARDLLGGRALADALTTDSWHKLRRALAGPRHGIEVVTAGGATLDVTAEAHDGGILLLLRDVSRYTTAAAKLADVTTQLARRNRDLETLYEVSATLGSTLNLDELGAATSRLLADYLGAAAVLVDVGEDQHAWPDADAASGEPDGAVPLTVPGRMLGRIAWWRSTPLAADEQRLVSLVAGRAAVGFDNAILHAAVERKADHDSLTGLLNRAGAERMLQDARLPAAVVLLDLDHFKLINDRWGHETGDAVLRRLARLLSGLPPPAVAARWGGEEFLVVLPTCTPDGAAAVVADLARRVRRAISVEGRPVTCSAGVAAWTDRDGFTAAVAAADEALYDAKRSGRDRVMVAATQPG